MIEPFLKLASVIIDKFIPVEDIRFVDGRIHIGTSVNVQDLLYRMNLKPGDREFLKQLRILDE